MWIELVDSGCAVLVLAARGGAVLAAAPRLKRLSQRPRLKRRRRLAAPTEGELPMVDPLTVTGDIVTAGSSTVYPLSEAMAERFINEGYSGNITIDSIGSGAGFERFCSSGETDISNASRPIKESEIACAAIGRTPIEIRRTDALAVVVNPENDWLARRRDDGAACSDLQRRCGQLVGRGCNLAAEPIQRFSRHGRGTYDFHRSRRGARFWRGGRDQIPGRGNLQLSEDDNVLRRALPAASTASAISGYAYYAENEGAIDILSIDGVDATPESVDANSYPLARPLFIYTDAGIMQSKPQVAAFVNFYLTYVNEEVERVGYFPASDEALDGARAAWLAAVGQ